MSTPTLDYTCASCGEPAALRCVRCLGAFYCGKECQKKMWREHKVLCKEAEKVLAGQSIDEFDKNFEASNRLAETGDLDAQFNLGLSYAKGTGVAIDVPKAIKWYTLAAEAGDLKAQYNLGNCYYHGEGITVDQREAVKW
jgi:TPR repeat protein